jgi:hypothetical protein
MGLIGLVFEIVVLGSCAAAGTRVRSQTVVFNVLLSTTSLTKLIFLSPSKVVTNILLIQACDLLDLERNGSVQGSLGLFQWDDPTDGNFGQCDTISDLEDKAIEDKAFKCARVCAILALCFGAILFVFGFFKQCLCALPCTQILMDLSSTCVQIMLALVYVIWLSEACDLYVCVYGNGATYLIVTQLLWLAAGCFSRCMREGRRERNKGEGN